MGGSFGGYMANWIAGHTDRFRAIVSHASLWALDQMFGTTDLPSLLAPDLRRPGRPSRSATRPTRRTCTPAEISTPMLVIHGDKDYRVPIGEALRLWCGPAAAGARTPSSCTSRDENHWMLTPGQRDRLVRDRPRLPGPARARRALAAPRSCSEQPDGRMTRAQLDKKPGEVSAMFDNVADRYDLLNDVLSLGPGPVLAEGRGPGGRRRARRAGARPGGRHRHLVAGLHRGRGALRRLRLLARHAAGSGAAQAGLAGSASWPATRWRCRSPTQVFDAVTISFGLRNVADPGRRRWPRCCGSPGPAAGW